MADTSINSWKLLYESGRQALHDRKLQEAEQSFSAALQLAEDFAAGDPRLAATLNALARIYSLQRRYLAAAALLNRLLEVTERTLGTSHVQVAGVLTNLAEMYTHLGAAREELELRERVLSIRVDDPNADANSLQRLRERVAELHSILAAQEATADLDEEIDQDPLPIVRTAEYSSPITTVREPETEIVMEPIAAREPIASPPSQPVVRHDESDNAYRTSPATSQLSVATWPSLASTAGTPASAETVETDDDDDRFSYDGEPKTTLVPSRAVEIISIDEQPVRTSIGSIDHGFSDMGRDELPLGLPRKMGNRSSLYSIAAGVVLVAGLLAARDYVKSSDDASVSAGSVSLATATPPQAVVTPVVQTTAPAPLAASDPDQRTVERLIADRRAERDARRANDERIAGSRSANEADAPITVRPPRVPSAADLEKTLKSVDVAVKSIDQRTKAAADSALAIRMQAPTFKKIRMADNQPQPQ